MFDPSAGAEGAVRSWLSPSSRITLKAEDVHIWRGSLDLSESSGKALEKLLTSDEADRAARFHFEADRRHYIAARGCLRNLLGRYLGMHPAEIRFNYNEFGKPSLAEPNKHELNFSLAHSGSLALYALTLKRQIGVDLEFIRRDFAVDEIAHRFFSAGEVEGLDRIPAALRHVAFFNCWTRKEAFVKAIGAGLSTPLDQFEVSLAPNEPVALLQTHWDRRDAARWSLAELDPGPGYVAAVAVAGHNWELRTWHFDESMLIEPS
jgi:4'-phosphopantetheinyl transferase